jgi:hypothetical protein
MTSRAQLQPITATPKLERFEELASESPTLYIEQIR